MSPAATAILLPEAPKTRADALVFASSDSFLVRAPLQTSGDAAVAPTPAGPSLALGPEGHLEILRSALSRAALREALELASPSLSDVLARVEAGDAASIRPKSLRRAALAALRYEIRAATRPTPFGIFAGVAQGSFGDDAASVPGSAHHTRTTADMQWLLRVVHRMETRDDVLDVLRVRTHQALVRRAGRVVLEAPSTRGRKPGEEGRSEVSVRESPVLAEILRAAREPLPVPELLALLTGRFGSERADALRRAVSLLVSEELLLTDLLAPLNGGDPLSHVLDVLGRVCAPSAETAACREQLAMVDRARAAYDAQPIGAGRQALTDLIGHARALEPADTPAHVDLRLDFDVRLPRTVQHEVELAADLLWRLSPRRLGMRPLRRYHLRFIERYGLDRVVPLLELLDDHRSLGAPFGYGWPASEAADEPPPDPIDTQRESVLAMLLDRALRAGLREVVLEDSDLRALGARAGDLGEAPNSCELYTHVVAPSLKAIEAGDFRITLSPSPGSHHAGATSGRFASLDATWLARLNAARGAGPVHVQDAMLADLAFAPRSGRAANLAHTVPATGRRITIGLPDAPGVDELALCDLAVGGTMQRLFLVHLPSGREVVPVLPHMVSPSVQAPNVARLLYELGMEGQRLWEPWSWGTLARMPFLPRVRRGRFVLAPATWRLDGLRDAAAANEEAWSQAVASWRLGRGVPRHVLAVSTDKRLLLDLDDAWHRELMRDDLRRDPELLIHEVAGEQEGWHMGDLRGHAVECVVALERRRRAAPQVPSPAWRDERRRVVDPESDWLFLRVYGPRRTQDALLRDVLPGIVERAAAQGADRWFYIRYTDADGHHLRLRLRGPRVRLAGAILPAVQELLEEAREAGRIAGHVVDHYEPETERYGGAEAVDAAELAFQADSRAAVELLDLARDPRCSLSIDALTVLSVAALAQSFGSPAGPTPWLADAERDDPALAWLAMTGTREELPDDYRRRAAHWRTLVDPVGGWPALAGDPLGDRALQILRARDSAVAAYGATTRELRAAGHCPTPEARIAGSLLHMTCNRLVGGDPEREQIALGIARGALQDNANRRRHTR